MNPLPFVSLRLPCKLCACLLVCTALPAVAGSLPSEDEPTGFTPDVTPDEQPWKERAIDLPPYPGQDHLLEFDIGSGVSPFRYFIDPASLHVDDDRVVRYTSVIISPSGVRNITYEGLHCGERSYRRYAYGSGGQWHTLPASTWLHVTGTGTQRYRNSLYENFMCPTADTPRDAAQILRRLRASRPRAGDW